MCIYCWYLVMNTVAIVCFKFPYSSVFFGCYFSILKMTVSTLGFIIGKLGGGFKYVLFSPLLEEMIQFD